MEKDNKIKQNNLSYENRAIKDKGSKNYANKNDLSDKTEPTGGIIGLENINPNPKRKRNLTAIIVGSTLAFVLTIVLSVTLTLAFFGGASTGSGTVTMGGPVNVNDTVVDTVNIAGALPGQKIDLNAQATINTTPTNPTNAILRAYFTWTVSDGAAIASPVIPTTAFNLNATADAKWVKHGDFYYLTNASDTNMAVIDLTASGNSKVVALVNNYTLSNELTNEVADKTITINVEFTAVQANLPVGADGALTTTVSMEQSREIFNSISTNDDATIIS